MSKHTGYLGHEKIEYIKKEIIGKYYYINGEWILITDQEDSDSEMNEDLE